MSTPKEVLTLLEARRVEEGISWQRLGERLLTDASSLSKTMNPDKGNPTLENLCRVSFQLGTHVVFLTTEEMSVLKSTRVLDLAATIADLQARNDRLISRLNAREEELETVKELNVHLQRAVARLSDTADRKDTQLQALISAQLHMFEKMMGKKDDMQVMK